jgi:hypothetical protein
MLPNKKLLKLIPKDVVRYIILPFLQYKKTFEISFYQVSPGNNCTRSYSYCATEEDYYYSNTTRSYNVRLERYYTIFFKCMYFIPTKLKYDRFPGTKEIFIDEDTYLDITEDYPGINTIFDNFEFKKIPKCFYEIHNVTSAKQIRNIENKKHFFKKVLTIDKNTKRSDVCKFFINYIEKNGFMEFKHRIKKGFYKEVSHECITVKVFEEDDYIGGITFKCIYKPELIEFGKKKYYNGFNYIFCKTKTIKKDHIILYEIYEMYDKSDYINLIKDIKNLMIT